MRRLSLCLLLTACTQFPQIDAVETPGIETAAYPDILPLNELLTSTPPRATPELRAGLESRADALRARAVGLQGPIIDDATRARMDRGVQEAG